MTDVAEWHALTPDDIDQVCRLASQAHPLLPERRTVLAEKQRLCPAGCAKLVAGAHMVGYALAHPWLLQAIPPLDQLLDRLPVHPRCLYVHDVVVAPEARGKGAAAAYLVTAERVALGLGLPALALVSVYGTHVLWRRLGFAVVRQPALQAALRSYGGSAEYMVKPLPTHPAG